MRTNFSVADVAGSSTFDNGVDAGLHIFVIEGDLQADLLQELYFGFRSAVARGITLLLTAAKNVSDAHLENAGFVKGFLDAAELFGLNVCGNDFHFLSPVFVVVRPV